MGFPVGTEVWVRTDAEAGTLAHAVVKEIITWEAFCERERKLSGMSEPELLVGVAEVAVMELANAPEDLRWYALPDALYDINMPDRDDAEDVDAWLSSG